MPKTEQFDREQVLNKAMQLFWQQGYEATSVQDIIQATGLKPGSIYNTFGDKHGFFMAVVQYYRQTVIEQALAVLQGPGSAKEAIENYLSLIISKFGQADHQFGCLMANSTAELVVRDTIFAQAARDHLHRLESSFRQVLERGVQQGELKPDINLAAQARFLTTCVVGLSVVSKTPEAKAYLSDSLEVILATLPVV